MKSAGLAIAASSAVLALTTPDVQAGGHRFVTRAGSAASAPRVHQFHSHPHTRVFIGGSFFFWPWPSYYYPAPYPYYYAPGEAPPAPLIEDPYWYYCEEAGTYYPYVKECPGGWQRVLPPAAPLG